jgi:hypothetical protein
MKDPKTADLDDFGTPSERRFTATHIDGSVETAEAIGLRMKTADGSHIQIDAADTDMQKILQFLSALMHRRRLEQEASRGSLQLATQPLHSLRVLPSPDGQGAVLQIAGQDQVLLSFSLSPRALQEMLRQLNAAQAAKSRH